VSQAFCDLGYDGCRPTTALRSWWQPTDLLARALWSTELRWGRARYWGLPWKLTMMVRRRSKLARDISMGVPADYDNNAASATAAHYLPEQIPWCWTLA
jgi:hypothetical protein